MDHINKKRSAYLIIGRPFLYETMRKKVIIPFLVFGAVVLTIAQNTVATIYYSDDLDDAYSLLYPNHQTTTFLIDNCGQIVHEWQDESNSFPGTTAQILINGNLLRSKSSPALFSSATFGAGGAGGVIEMLTWDNELIWQYVIADSLKRQHHEIRYMPNGHVLAIVWEKKNLDQIVAAGFDTLQYTQREIWSDFILEIDPETDSIVWEWHAWDHLIQEYDSTKLNFGPVHKHPERIDLNYQKFTFERQDWMHSNAVDYNEHLDQIVLSVKNFNEIWIIDHSTTSVEAAGHEGGKSGIGGDLMFRWGNPAAFQQGSEDDQQLFYNHNAHWIGGPIENNGIHKGKISIFNNAIENGLSRGEILSPVFDTISWNYLMDDSVFLPLATSLKLTHPEVEKTYSTSASNMQVLPSGNFLLCAARQGRVFEINAAGDLLWEYLIPMKLGYPVPQGTMLDLSDNFTFQVIKYPIDYPAFQNQDLSPDGYIELDPDLFFCISTEVQEKENKQVVFFRPNPASTYLILESDILRECPFRIFDSKGKFVSKGILIQDTQKIDIQDLPDGLYLISLDNRITIKFLISK